MHVGAAAQALINRQSRLLRVEVVRARNQFGDNRIAKAQHAHFDELIALRQDDLDAA